METTSTLPVVVESGGDQGVGHVGLHALGDFADRLGLGEHLSERIPIPSERAPVHDRGKVLVHSALMLWSGSPVESRIRSTGLAQGVIMTWPSVRARLDELSPVLLVLEECPTLPPGHDKLH